jgi:membrane protease YdiL (CAAX protease family)
MNFFVNFLSIITLLSLAYFLKPRAFGNFKIRRLNNSATFALLICVFLVVISITSAILINDPFVQERDIYVKEHPDVSALTIFIASCLYAPIIEEILFRGMILRFLFFKRKIRLFISAAVSSLLWTIMHEDFDFLFVIETFIFGIALSYLAIRSKTIFYCVAIHVINNVAGWFLN